MISADLHALMVRSGSGKGALWCVYVGGRGGGRGRSEWNFLARTKLPNPTGPLHSPGAGVTAAFSGAGRRGEEVGQG